jgi:hypothetical protein
MKHTQSAAIATILVLSLSACEATPTEPEAPEERVSVRDLLDSYTEGDTTSTGRQVHHVRTKPETPVGPLYVDEKRRVIYCGAGETENCTQRTP